MVSPFSAHVTLAAVEGEDREGYIIFSIGAACRETRQASLLKAILEAVQGRHYVRLLVEQQPTDPPGWLTAHAAPIERLASGAYLSVQRDKATCALTAQLTGLQGQLCATLLLDGSADCTARVNVKSDGTVVMYVQDKCALTFWPHLAR